MKPSLEKLQKIFSLEAERGYDNHAVLGGLERLLDHWEAEARIDELPEDLIQAVIVRVRDYGRLKQNSRAEALDGLTHRIQRSEAGSSFKISTPKKKPEPANQSAQRTQNHSPKTPEAGKPTPSKTKPFEKKPLPNEKSNFKRAKIQPISDEPAALDAPIKVLDGIGEKLAQTLERLNIKTLRDMLYFFPRDYIDYRKCKPINRLEYGEVLTVIGTVQRVGTRNIKGNKQPIVEAVVSDGSGSLRITWFGQSWQAKRLHKGMQISLSGKIDQYLGRPVMTNPEWERIDQQQLNTNRIVPVYRSTAGISQRWLRQKINNIASYWAPRVQDQLPEEIQAASEVVDIRTALWQIHSPDTWEDLAYAQERIAFDEIFLLQLGVLSQKREWEKLVARPFSVADDWIDERINSLPYVLTNAQKQAIIDIRHDLASGHPMNRLLQGDVGSGKTIVAALAASIITSQGAQAAFMAPTSILAEQHYKNLTSTLTEKNQNSLNTLHSSEIKLLLGKTSETEKEEIRAGLLDGSIKVIIGTHALLEEPVQFANLQLGIIDEQHRFGVKQRSILRSKGENPHLLVMTATPIPRSLALTIYGDLDLSVMDELPPGRKPVGTYVLMPRERERAYNLIRSQIKEGHQAFIIYPLVEESENVDAKAAIDDKDRLQTEIFPDLKVGLLHGRMAPEEKESIMSAFHRGEYQILVSTSVIEVGVDVPNATVMIIEGANRFGLAQLHQFRGRVGRSADKSYCILIPNTSDQAENERLKVMVETNDGFVLAERDLEQRGPGQFLGSRQSGFADFKQAKLTDIHLIEKSRRLAKHLFEKDPEISLPEHQLLASTLQHSWESLTFDIS
jgi:ATP-dependent DNA helicase RecG